MAIRLWFDNAIILAGLDISVCTTSRKTQLVIIWKEWGMELKAWLTTGWRKTYTWAIPRLNGFLCRQRISDTTTTFIRPHPTPLTDSRFMQKKGKTFNAVQCAAEDLTKAIYLISLITIHLKHWSANKPLQWKPRNLLQQLLIFQTCSNNAYLFTLSKASAHRKEKNLKIFHFMKFSLNITVCQNYFTTILSRLKK